jgi:GTPase SAR1 family protein
MHGPQYTPYDSQQLLRLLNDLVQTNYLNILILGETGVGKSTFINAMVNYLEFESLDEAIDAEKLNYVIPCSFATQIMDRTNPNRPIEEKRIKIGARDDEHDGSKGDSATQKTTVYPVTFRSGDSTLTVRLIDTPGIGDSRGVEADRSNMADILSTLSGYDTVHGILILLKSNNARLTITFKYCVKELLTHLHHKAAANMAFGFTNTRISNYTPGDTYGPLKTLLDQHPDVGLHLETPTTYCFDSESFRYLAAHKSGVTMPNKLDFDRSWEQSRTETIRLIDHFQAIEPHEVKSTLSLNGARQLISELTKPLAEISQLINTNIQLVEDQMEALKDTRVKGDELRNMLQVQKVQMNSETLSMPRTVCADKSCIDVRDDGKGQDTMVIVYKKHCHPVCYLDDVQKDVMSYPSLIHCAAFSGGRCTNCSHHWSQHLHVLYELHEETVTMNDTGIEQQLANHADEITLRQTGITKKETLVSEYREEQETIRDAAAQFCVFLKKNSLAPYNDALIAYLDFLIKEEQAKVQAGGNDKRLLSLTEERHKHQEAIEVITRNMNSTAAWNDLSEGGVDRMVRSLYNLKHWGENLKNLKHGITTAHEATYRERPYTVKRRHQPRNVARVANRPSQYRPSQYQPNQYQTSQYQPSRAPPAQTRRGSLNKKFNAPSGSSGTSWTSTIKRGFGFT